MNPAPAQEEKSGNRPATRTWERCTTAPAYQWGYNTAGELVSADDTTGTANDRAYLFDAIGNRQRAASGTLDPNAPGATTYTANALNQYMAIGSLNPAYDADGNMTSGPLPVDPATNASLMWDAENRLVAVTVNGNTTTYGYDHLSRRVRKTAGTNVTRYLYDGWNPVAEYAGTTLAKTYTWGTDLSGSMQGAGGVGGLLAVKIHTGANAGTYCPTYDGNGNISEYLGSNGTVAAHYEYDAFGNLTKQTGAMVDTFAHRFSTKPLDPETGLYYYGYRYYDPVTGRWPSRDPIEESGGYNLYGMVGNSPINFVDILGNKGTASSGGKSVCECLVFYLQLQGEGRKGAGIGWGMPPNYVEGPRRPFPGNHGNLPVERPDWKRWHVSGSHPDQRWAVGAEWKPGVPAATKSKYLVFDLQISAVNPYPSGSGRRLAISKSRSIQGAIGTKKVVTGKDIRGNKIVIAPIPALPPLGSWPTEAPPVNPVTDHRNATIEYKFKIMVGDAVCMERQFKFIEAWEGGLGTGTTPGVAPRKLPTPPKP